MRALAFPQPSAPPHPTHGSLQGAAPAQGHCFSAIGKLVGVELNDYFANLSAETSRLFRLDDRIEVRAAQPPACAPIGRNARACPQALLCLHLFGQVHQGNIADKLELLDAGTSHSCPACARASAVLDQRP